jgi:hypothetical protein
MKTMGGTPHGRAAPRRRSHSRSRAARNPHRPCRSPPPAPPRSSSRQPDYCRSPRPAQAAPIPPGRRSISRSRRRCSRSPPPHRQPSGRLRSSAPSGLLFRRIAHSGCDLIRDSLAGDGACQHHAPSHQRQHRPGRGTPLGRLPRKTRGNGVHHSQQLRLIGSFRGLVRSCDLWRQAR